MGVTLSLLAHGPPSIAISSYVDVLDKINYHSQLGNSRFLKTIRATDQHGDIVIKLFIKPDDSFQLGNWYELLEKQRMVLQPLPNILNYSKIFETERAGYLIRQYLKFNLHYRLTTRPFLEELELRWVAFQLIKALIDIHSLGITHGDLKTENVLVTSWNWVMLTDLGSFKPVYLPEDNPGDFSFYFDTSQRRSCYLAPERFSNELHNKMKGGFMEQASKKMDIFSCGCVVAELFMQGESFMTLSQLFKYKTHEYDPSVKIQQPILKELVNDMISVEPCSRLKLEDILEKYRGTFFPDYFYTFLYDYSRKLADNPIAASVDREYRSTEPETKIKGLYNNFHHISKQLSYDFEYGDGTLCVQMPRMKSIMLRQFSKIVNHDAGLLILDIVLHFIRNLKSATVKIQCLDLILVFSERVDDRIKLDRSLPYIMLLLRDESINVQTHALRVLKKLLLLVENITLLNSTVFSDFIIPRLRKFLTANDNSYVTMVFAECLPGFARAALHIHECSQVLNSSKSQDEIVQVSKKQLVHDFEKFTIGVLTSDSIEAKVTLLGDLMPLCSLFEKERTNDVVLSHLITYLNDKSSMLRMAFVKCIVPLSVYVGHISLEQYILPLLVQTLTDPEELVVVEVLHSLKELVVCDMIRDEYIWDLTNTVSKLLLHPNEWIKQGTVSLIVAIASNLPLADVYCLLYPLVRPFVEYDIDFTWSSLYCSSKKQLPRSSFNLLCAWSLRSDKSLFWRQVSSHKVNAFGMREPVFVSKGQTSLFTGVKVSKQTIKYENIEVPLTPEDKNWLERIRSSGMSDGELWKCAAFRGYCYSIAKMKTDVAEEDNQAVAVLPRNVFFDVKFTAVPTSASMSVSSFSSSQLSLPIPMQVSNSNGGLVLSTSKPLPTITANEEHVYVQLEPSVVHNHTAHTVVRNINSDTVLKPTVKTSYNGSDPYIIKYLNSTVIEPELLEYPEFGPCMVSMGNRVPKEGWRYGDTVVAHLTEHTEAVNVVRACSNSSYFVSGGEDGILKVWDVLKLERKMNPASSLTIDLDAKIIDICFIDNYSVIAVLTNTGLVSLYRITIDNKALNRFTKIAKIRHYEFDNKMEHGLSIVYTPGDYSLVVVTNLSKIVSLDIRTMKCTQVLQNDVFHGATTAVCTDGTWALVGTSKGALDLWDLRFGLHINSWTYGSNYPISKLIHLANYKNTAGPYVAIFGATGDSEFSIWDISKWACREVFMTKNAEVGVEQYATREFVITPPAMTLPHRMVTAAEYKDDHMIVCDLENNIMDWNLVHKQDSRHIEKDTAIAMSQVSSTMVVVTETGGLLEQPSREKSIASSKNQELLKRHHDIITGVAIVTSPFPMLISCDRTGVINIYK